MEKVIFISKELPASLEGILSKYAEVRCLPSLVALPEPISSHADILSFYDEASGELWLTREYYNNNKELFSDVKVRTVNEELGKSYPKDVLLDAISLGEALICKESATAEMIKQGKRVINVKQGYAKCSACVLKKALAITADEGIRDALESLGVKVLFILPGNIRLEGYSYGFIGGACLVIENRVIFFGNVAEHPDGERILEFIKENGFEAEYPTDFPLTDLGSAVIADKEKK